jgi:hypothetical protein
LLPRQLLPANFPASTRTLAGARRGGLDANVTDGRALRSRNPAGLLRRMRSDRFRRPLVCSCPSLVRTS